AELAAVAIQRVGLEAQLPAQVIAVLDVLHGGFVGKVDRLADSAADKRLRPRHHADMPFGGDEAAAVLAALAGAIEDRVMLLAQMRRALHGAPATDLVIGLVDLLPCEAQPSQQVEARRLPFTLGDFQALEGVRRKRPW